jgi:hypothetical protein
VRSLSQRTKPRGNSVFLRHSVHSVTALSPNSLRRGFGEFCVTLASRFVTVRHGSHYSRQHTPAPEWREAKRSLQPAYPAMGSFRSFWAFTRSLRDSEPYVSMGRAQSTPAKNSLSHDRDAGWKIAPNAPAADPRDRYARNDPNRRSDLHMAALYDFSSIGSEPSRSLPSSPSFSAARAEQTRA